MLRHSMLALLLSVTAVAGRAQTPAATPPKSDLAPLFANIWRITSPTPYPNSGSIYIFLRNGTLLETSCVETYRIATWKAAPNKPGTIQVTEDGRLAFTAKVLTLTDRELRLQQTMAIGNHEVRDMKFEAIDKEFVCPDMPK